MSIKVKHDGNATPGAFAAAAGGQGKRAQQDAAQMSQIMQSAANAGNQQLRGASAPGAAPGHTTAQLVHAQAPIAGGGGVSGGMRGSGGGGSGGIDAYEQRKMMERKLEYDKQLKNMGFEQEKQLKNMGFEQEKQLKNIGIEGDLAKISRQASENRGNDVWRARVDQAQHPDYLQGNGFKPTGKPSEVVVENSEAAKEDKKLADSYMNEQEYTDQEYYNSSPVNQPSNPTQTGGNETTYTNRFVSKLNSTLSQIKNSIQNGFESAGDFLKSDYGSLVEGLNNFLRRNGGAQNDAQQAQANNNVASPVENVPQGQQSQGQQSQGQQSQQQLAYDESNPYYGNMNSYLA